MWPSEHSVHLRNVNAENWKVRFCARSTQKRFWSSQLIVFCLARESLRLVVTYEGSCAREVAFSDTCLIPKTLSTFTAVREESYRFPFDTFPSFKSTGAWPGPGQVSGRSRKGPSRKKTSFKDIEVFGEKGNGNGNFFFSPTCTLPRTPRSRTCVSGGKGRTTHGGKWPDLIALLEAKMSTCKARFKKAAITIEKIWAKVDFNGLFRV